MVQQRISLYYQELPVLRVLFARLQVTASNLLTVDSQVM